MPHITLDNSNELNLNLLNVLLTVLQEGSATAAARRLHVTQSAVSNSLARLRVLFNDPLVTRHGNGLVATPLAASLRPRLEQALTDVIDAVRAVATFSPLLTKRCFTLACSDVHHFHDLPMLAAAFRREMPQAQLRVVSLDTLEAAGGLEASTIDAALAPLPAVTPGQPFEELYADGFAFVVRKDHPRVGKALSLKQFNSERHVDTLVVQGRGGVGHRLAGDLFSQLGLVRDVALSVPTFSAAGLAAAQSDLVAGLPARLAAILCRLLPLRQVRTPVPAIAIQMCLTWPARADADAGARCFRRVVAETLRAANSSAVSLPRRPA